MDPIRTVFILIYIVILYSHVGLLLCFPSDHFHSNFQTLILYEFLMSLVRSTYPPHIILSDFISLITFGKEHTL